MDNIFDRFVKNINEITETWQIVEFFEDEYRKLKEERGEIEKDKLKEQENLKIIRAEYLEIQGELKQAKEELERTKSLQAESNKQNLDSIDNLRKNLPIRPLEKVDIKLKDGIVVKANPAGDVFSKEIVEKYITCLRELKTLKSKLMNSDLEIAKLHNEIKDIKAERKTI